MVSETFQEEAAFELDGEGRESLNRKGFRSSKDITHGGMAQRKLRGTVTSELATPLEERVLSSVLGDRPGQRSSQKDKKGNFSKPPDGETQVAVHWGSHLSAHFLLQVPGAF